MKKRLTSLQALRAIAFLGIFSSHCRLNTMFGAAGVATFFILSGFVMTYSYWDREVPNSLDGAFKFAIRKIKTIYPLHLLMLIAAVPYQLFNTRDIFQQSFNTGLVTTLVKAVLNVSLLQSWVPDLTYSASFNGVSWFLSNCLFLYFIFGFILKKVKNLSYLKSIYYVIFIYITMVLFCLIHHKLNYYDEYWISYTCPILRSGDFAIGCLLANVFMCNSVELDKRKWTIIECMTLAVLVTCAFLYEAPAFTGQNWFRLTVLWTPVAATMVFIFANKKGSLTKLLDNKGLVYLGNTSNHMFLIHGMVVTYVWILYGHFIIERYNIQLTAATSYLANSLLAIMCLGITIVAVKIYRSIEAKYTR